MTRSNYAAERANDLPVYEVIELPVEEIELHDVSKQRFRDELAAMSSPDDDDFEEEFVDDDAYSFSTNSFAYGYDPTELDAESGHRAFCNNFSD